MTDHFTADEAPASDVRVALGAGAALLWEWQ
jgi:hypothetical protein